MTDELKDFLTENGVILERMRLLGSGENGTAWRCGGLVVKQTRSQFEYDFAVEQTRGEWPHFATVYATAKNDELYFYIAEYLKKSEDIGIWYDMCESAVGTQGIDMLECYEFDMASFLLEYPKGLSKSCLNFFRQMVEIAVEYQRIGASDMHKENLGWNSEGNLKAFDIDIAKEDKEIFG